MQTSIFGFGELNEYGSIWWKSLQARKNIFVDECGWDIPHNSQVEFDGYDRPDTSYIVVHDDDVIYGGIRLIPTTGVWGPHTSMIGDAYEGKLDNIPRDLVDFYCPEPNVFEASRIFVNVKDHRRRLTTLYKLFDSAIQELHRRGGDIIISINPVSMMKPIRRSGLSSIQAGRSLFYGGDEHAVIATSKHTEEYIRYCLAIPKVGEDLPLPIAAE
ncbi:MAG: acyl-homoserine-lactone synthase [Pseudomonadota bacterium]